MSSTLGFCVTAFVIGLTHTAIGPDHYVPFVAMSKVGRWSLSKTLWITAICGVGHVASSVLLGAAGMLFGAVLFLGDAAGDKLQALEADRAALASWLLLAFGLMYFTWGVWRAIRNRPHAHPHVHADGTVHAHMHQHQGEHLHVHEAAAVGSADPPAAGQAAAARSRMTPWVLFTIFLFGPCEALIPLMMSAALQGNPWKIALITLAFSLATVGTMLAAVSLLCAGVGFLERLGAKCERFSHALAGAAVLSCGLAIKLGICP